MLPTLTPAQEEQAKKQLTTDEYQNLKVSDHAGLRQFYEDWLDAFAESIREAACEKCIPPWLLAAVLLGEVTAMNEYFGIDERTLEELGLGSSVGLAQITVDTTLEYGLTESAKNFDKVCAFVAHRLGQFTTAEAIFAEWTTTPIDKLPTTPPPHGPAPDSEQVKDLARFLVRRELLNPLISIRASACYLRELIDQAIKQGAMHPYTAGGREPWGTFDFSKTNPEDCPIEIDGGSDHPDETERRTRTAKFFGGAHNDNSLTGFSPGVGLTQGENAGNVADDLIEFDLISQYNLNDCP